MITIPGPVRPHVVISRGVSGLPTARLSLGDTCSDTSSGDPYECGSSGLYDGGSSGSGVTFADLTAAQQAAWLGAGGSSTPGASPPTNWAAILQGITAAGNAASQAIRTTQSPYYLPGSNTLYNPATGQLTNQVGVTATSSTPLLLGALAIGAILLFALKK